MLTATLESFKKELKTLVDEFSHRERTYKKKDYIEDHVRSDFLDKFFMSLGWDRYNIKKQDDEIRDVDSESQVKIDGNIKRIDYLFRTNGIGQFICEAKKPIEKLDEHALQAKRYAWYSKLKIATLTDFEDFHIYVVGARPEENEPAVGQYKIWNYKKYVECAEELWDLFSYENVKSGSLVRLVEGLPKKARGKKQGGYAIKPDRTKPVDKVFLSMLEKSRLELGKNIFKNNGGKVVFEHNQINESVQRILDRIVFLRFCEARGIETGQTLESICDKSQHAIDGTSAYEELAKHFQKLGKPTSNVPFFNGNLFSKHFSEALTIDNKWLLEFIDNLSGEKSPYLFEVMPIEILGSIYEQFLGKQLVAKGSGVAVDEKPAVKKAGGVYYTPRYIVDYIVEQTLGKQLSEIANGNGQRPSLKDFEKQTSALKVLDPACGSGSFLIRAFERICEHWERRLKDDLPFKDAPNRAAWEKEHRTHCYIDPQRDAVFLTVGLKKKILLDNIYGVDIDSAAVEVTQLSLYLKMLEHETKTTLVKQKDLFPSDIAILPALKDNIKCGNSLISSDIEDLEGKIKLSDEERRSVNPFNWKNGFEIIMKGGGFDTVIGNPPYVRIQTMLETAPESVNYLKAHYSAAAKGNYDIYVVFIERVLEIINKTGKLGYIVPHKFLNAQYGKPLRSLLADGRHLHAVVHFGDQQVFDGPTTYTCLLFLTAMAQEQFIFASVDDLPAWKNSRVCLERSIPSSSLCSKEWSFNAGPESAVLDRLFADPIKLKDVAHLFVGLQTDADDVFILELRKESDTESICYSKATDSEHAFERAHLKPLLKGSVNIRRYELDSIAKRLIFPYEIVDGASVTISENDYKRRFPKTWRYLELNRDRLEERNNGIQPSGWYGYIYKKNHTRFGFTKIVVPSLGTGSCFALDSEGVYYFVGSGAGGGGGYAVVPNPSFTGDIRSLLGLLNSRLLSFLIQKTSTPFRGGYIALNRQYIESLPIRALDKGKHSDCARHDRLVLLVDKLLGWMPKLRLAVTDSEKTVLQNAITATDHEIDRLVYDLYGLTEDEIKLVEESSEKKK